MVYKRRYRRYGRKYVKKSRTVGKKYGRKWFKRKLRSSRTKQPQYAPDRYFTKLRYSEYRTVDDALTGVGYMGNQNITANSLYDPDAEVGGLQPYGFDQLAVLYSSYRVHACKIKVKIHGVGGTVGQSIPPYYVGVFPYTELDSLPSAVDWIGSVSERPYSKVVTRNAFDSSPTITAVMSTAKILGLSKTAAKTDPRLSAEIDSSPANVWYYRISYGQLNPNATDYARYVVQIRVTYYCEFFGRKQLPRS